MFTLWKTHLSGQPDADLVIFSEWDMFRSWLRNTRRVLVCPYLGATFLNLFYPAYLQVWSRRTVASVQKGPSPVVSYSLPAHARHFRRREGKSCCTSDLYSAKLCLRWRGWNTTTVSHNPEAKSYSLYQSAYLQGPWYKYTRKVGWP